MIDSRQPVQRRIVRRKDAGEAPARKAPLPVSVRLIALLALLILIGTLLLLLPGMSVRQLSPMEAFFTATSAATVTGLTLFDTSTTFTLAGQIVILLLIQMGGLGLMVAIVLVLRLLGRRITLMDRLAVTSSLGLDRPTAIVAITRRAVVFMLLIEGIGALLLFLHWSINDIVPDTERALFYAVFHSVTAFCNAGFDLFVGLSRYPEGLPGDSLTLIILGTLVVLGGLGIPVYMDILYRQPGTRLALHTRITIVVSLVLIVGGFIGIVLGEYVGGGLLRETSFWNGAVRSLFQSISARTAGFPGLAGFEELQQDSRLLIMLLMFIGSGPASMGGGITTGSFAVLGLAVVSYARGFSKIRVWGRTISPGSLWRATAILVVGFAAVAFATWLLLLLHPVSVDVALFEAVSAFSTTGLSLGMTSELNDVGRLVIILMMFWGRLGAVTVMLALLQRKSADLLVDYPEETVLVG